MSSFLATYRRPSAKPVFVYESDNIDSDFVCSICQEPFVDPVVEPACRQMFCRACLAAWLMKSSSCPQCRQPTALGRVTLPPRFVTTRLDDLRVVCPSCRGSYARKSLHKHRAICAPCNKKRHEDVECSAKVVACGGAEFGCKFTAPRGRMPAHEEQCWPTLHLALRHQLDKIEKLVRSLEDRRNPQARALDTVKRGVVVDRSRRRHKHELRQP